jgi:thiaminase
MKPCTLAHTDGHLKVIAWHEFYSRAIEGTLTQRQLGIYLAQDNLYLKEFAGILHYLSNRSNRRSWKTTLSRHQKVVLASIADQRHFVSEVLMAPVLLRDPMRPTTYAYVNHLRRNLSSTEPAMLATLLPCYLFYARAVRRLHQEGSANRTISEWITSLPHDRENDKYVAEILELYESVAPTRSVKEITGNYSRSAAYEVLFLEMALRDEQWPRTTPAANT